MLVAILRVIILRKYFQSCAIKKGSTCTENRSSLKIILVFYIIIICHDKVNICRPFMQGKGGGEGV